MSNLIKILSIDGGGIRGIIPAMVMAEIEKRTQKPVSELFHLIAGTSTGGILALGLTKPDSNGRPEYTAEAMTGLYGERGERIFSRSIWHKIHSVWSLKEEKYSAEGLEEVLDEYFREARLKHSLADVLVTSYEIEGRFPFFFKSTKAKVSDAWDFAIKEVARATSAAPTYFEPLKLEIGNSSEYYVLIDGGVYANNPAMCAYVEAKSTHPDATDFLVVSLGTGVLTRKLPYDEAKDWGLAAWAPHIINIVFDGVDDTVDYQLKHLLPSTGGETRRYYRLQTTLDEGNDDMDDASKTNIRVLKLKAEDIIREHSDALDVLCDWLVKD